VQHVKELRVALVGAGFMGRAHSLAFGVTRLAGDLEAHLIPVVVADADRGLAESFARQFGWPESTDDWAAAIRRDDIDVVDICTPPQFHEEIALAAIAAGKSVFCEKPITNDSAQAISMAQAAAAAGVTAQVGFNYRHTPALGFARKLVDEGALGTVMHVRGSYLQDTGFGADPGRWRATKKTGGSGTVGDIGSHVIDIAESLCGDVVRVAARMRSGAVDGGWQPEAIRLEDGLIDDAGVWIAEFSSGVIGSFSVSSFSSGSKNRVSLQLDGSQGAVEFGWNDREILNVSYSSDPADQSGFRSISTNDKHPDGGWRLAGLGTGYLDVSAVQFQKFIRSITSGVKHGPDFFDAAHVQQVVEAITDAAASDSWVDVPRRHESTK
jgi:predicted dehydrogenase